VIESKLLCVYHSIDCITVFVFMVGILILRQVLKVVTNETNTLYGPMIVSYTRRRNKLCFIYTIRYSCISFTSHINVLNENTLSEPKVSKSLDFITNSYPHFITAIKHGYRCFIS